MRAIPRYLLICREQLAAMGKTILTGEESMGNPDADPAAMPTNPF